MNQAHTRSSSFDVPLKCGRLASTRATKGAHPDARRAALAERVFLVTIARYSEMPQTTWESGHASEISFQKIGILIKKEVGNVILASLAPRSGDPHHAPA
jgi:hypothetical protein